MKKIILLVTSLLFSQTVFSAEFFPYNELLLKDLEQMESLVSKKIKEYEKSGETSPTDSSGIVDVSESSSSDNTDDVADFTEDSAESSTPSANVTPLKEALQAVYSRPNLDDMIQKVIAPLRTALENVDAWEKTTSSLIDEGLANLKNPKKVKPRVQATYAIMLDNFVNEFRVYADADGFEKKMLEKIKKADIDLSKEARAEIKLRVLKEPVSPSELARVTLKAVEKNKKKKK